MIEPGVAPDGGENAKGDAEDRGQDDRHEGQLEGRRQPVDEIVGDRALGVEADAEIALGNAEDVVPELNRHRLVDAELRLQGSYLLGGGVVAGNERDGIGRNDVADGERDREQAQQGGQEPGQTVDGEDERTHRSVEDPRPAGAGREGLSGPPDYSMETQRISWPLPIGLKRTPLTFLLNGPNHLVL